MPRLKRKYNRCPKRYTSFDIWIEWRRKLSPLGMFGVNCTKATRGYYTKKIVYEMIGITMIEK